MWPACGVGTEKAYDPPEVVNTNVLCSQGRDALLAIHAGRHSRSEAGRHAQAALVVQLVQQRVVQFELLKPLRF